MNPTRTRGYVFTLNNPKDNGLSKETVLEILKRSNIKYAVIGDEVAPTTGTPHLQGYVEFVNTRTRSGVNKLLKVAYIETRKGSPEEAANYCKKCGNFIEFGSLPQQGERTDLMEARDLILSGECTLDELAVEDPHLFHKYGRTLAKLEEIKHRQVGRTEMTKGVWLWGPTGVGKSHRAFEGYDHTTHYVYPNDKGWWDGYVGQKIVIFNDFRGELPYNFLLQLLDKWPVSVPRRNRAPMPFTSERIIFTSSIPPQEIYHGIVEKGDSISQLLRRIELVHVVKTDPEVPGGNNNPQVLTINNNINNDNATDVLTHMLKA